MYLYNGFASSHSNIFLSGERESERERDLIKTHNWVRCSDCLLVLNYSPSWEVTAMTQRVRWGNGEIRCTRNWARVAWNPTVLRHSFAKSEAEVTVNDLGCETHHKLKRTPDTLRHTGSPHRSNTDVCSPYCTQHGTQNPCIHDLQRVTHAQRLNTAL